MSKRMFILIVAVVAGTALFFWFQFDSKSESKNTITFSPQVSFSADYLNRASIPEIAYTDENESEDLIIRSDKDVYNEFSKSLVFFSVTPLKSRVEKVGFQFIFSDKDAGIIALYQKKKQGWEAIPYSKGALGDQAVLTEAYPKRKEINQNFAINANAFYENYGEPAIFAVELYYPPNTSGEFLIEAFGSQGGYGLLDPWYNSSWQYRKRITVHPDKIATSTNFNNFPMLFSVTDPDFKDTANGGKFASSTAGEIVFTDHLGNKIDHEIEQYVETTGKLIAWVEAPNLNATTTLYVYYGNGTIPLANQQNATGVWDANYKGVWHLPNETTLTALDSTSNANNGTISGPTATAGKVDGAGNFDGVNDKITFSQDVTPNQTQVSFSGWIAPDVVSGGLNQPIYSEPSTADCGIEEFQVHIASTNLVLMANDATMVSTAHSFQSGQLYYIAAVFNSVSDVHSLYINGVQITGSSVQGAINNVTVDAGIGANPNSVCDRWFDGKIDEARISNTVRSSDWIKTEYNNQSSPSTFYAVGGEEQITRPTATASVRIRSGTGSASKWYGTGWQYRKRITVHPDKIATSTNFNNFPMLFSVTDPDFKFVDFSGKFASSTAGEIVFTDHLGNKIDHEIEEYASTTGKLIAWVEAPNLTATTTLYVYYGNSTVPLANQATTTGVWDTNYVGVWHLKATTTLNANDSTSNANNGTINLATAITGTIDGAADFSTSNAYINFGRVSALEGVSQVTFELWGSRNPINRRVQFMKQTASDNMIGFEAWEDGLVYGEPTAGTTNFGSYSSNDTNWHHWVMVFDGTQANNATRLKIYDNGVEQTLSFTGTVQSTTALASADLIMGRDAAVVNGLVDEARVSVTVRSSDWIKTEYNNQSSPSTFYAVGGEEQITRPAATASVRIRSGTGSASKWYGTGWQYRKKITIHPDKVATSTKFNNFPMLFSVTDPDFKFVDFSGKFASSTAGEIVFTDHLGNKIDHEIEEYASTTGKLIAWVEAPNLTATTTLYVYYGNGTIPLANQATTTGVWDSNYVGVWHLRENPTTNSCGGSNDSCDSTSNANHTAATNMEAGDQKFGKINGSLEFDGVDECTSRVGNLTGLSFATPLTLSAWIKQSTLNKGQIVGVGSNFPATGGWGLYIDGPNGALQFLIPGVSTPLSTLTISANTWAFVAVTLTSGGTNPTFYLNTQSQTVTNADAITTAESTDTLIIGDYFTCAALDDVFAGLIDNVRISNIARSSDWIKTEYNNQSSPSTFYAVGGEEQNTRPASTPSVKFR